MLKKMENQKDTPGKLLAWHYNQLSLAQTNFHGPKGVRATEVRL